MSLNFGVADGPGGALVVNIRGVIGHTGASHLEATLTGFARHGRPRIILDLTGVVLIDSTGLTALLRIQRETGRAGGWLRLARLPRRVGLLFDRTNLSRLLPSYESVGAAAEGH